MSRGVKKTIIKEESNNSHGKRSHILRKEWKNDDDRRLKKAIEYHGTNWLEVSSFMGDRNPS